MERQKFIIAMALLLMAVTPTLTACGTDDGPVTENPAVPTSNPEQPGEGDGNNNGNDNNENNEGENEMNKNIIIRVDNHSFTTTLEDNPTARAFAAMLPMTVTMNEMNGNEKYFYLSGNLPTDSYRPATIRNGDLMLYGSTCVVLFYETFSSSYSYTRIGRVDNPSGLPAALGGGNSTVTFEVNNNPN